MKISPKLLCLALCLLTGGVHDAFATDRFYRDITAESPSKKFKLEAVSPDNAGEKKGRGAFQSSFVYTLRDVKNNKVLWTRKQPMKTETESSYLNATEDSPVALFVSDVGWTVIETGWYELIVVDIDGKDRGHISILKDGLTEDENTEYVHQTTAGPRWGGYSLWYFLGDGEQPLFVVQPWWGRRIILDLKSAKIIPETPDIAKQAAFYEKNYVLDELRRDTGSLIKTTSDEKEECDTEAYWRYALAAYVAGRDKITEAIPLLEKLQISAHIGRSTGGAFWEEIEGKVDPSEYWTFTLRQVVQLSLRRLGKTPRQLPATRFDVIYRDYDKRRPYVAKKIDGPRAANAGKIKTGMKPEEVLDLIGAPDFVQRDPVWEYDMDTGTPFTLLVYWQNGRTVYRVEQETPARWQDGQIRDRKIVY